MLVKYYMCTIEKAQSSKVGQPSSKWSEKGYFSMQIGFIGIGVMGRPMSLHVLKAGHHVTIFARHPEKAEVQEELNAGAKLAPSPRAVAIASDMVLTMVPNSAQGEGVLCGRQSILDGAR